MAASPSVDEGMEEGFSSPPSSSKHRQTGSGNNSTQGSSVRDDEDWTTLPNVVDRRKIQNRIAQRNYRKNIKKRLEDLERLNGAALAAASAARHHNSAQSLYPTTPDLSPDANFDSFFSAPHSDISYFQQPQPQPASLGTGMMALYDGWSGLGDRGGVPTGMDLSMSCSLDESLINNKEFVQNQNPHNYLVSGTLGGTSESQLPYTQDTAMDNYVGTAFHKAVFYGHEAVVRLLLEKGANAEMANAYGQRPLHLAVEQSHIGVTRMLLHNGADYNARGANDRTPLHLAALSACEPIIRMLVERPVNLNATDNSGYTALHLAAEHGHETAVRLLLNAGADLNA